MNFLNNLPIDQIGLTIAMIVIVVLFAAITIVKGIIKMIVTFISLGVAAVAFVFGYLKSPPFIQQFIPEAVGWMPLVVGGVCALLALVLIQVVRSVFTGKKKNGDNISATAAKSSSGRSPLAPLFGLFVGTVVLYGVLTAARFGGTKAELDYLRSLVQSGLENAPPKPILAKLNAWLDKSPIAGFHEKLDPFYDRSKANLAKLMVLADNSRVLARALSDPENKDAINKTEIKSLCLLPNTQRELARTGHYAELFKDERFARIANRPSLQQGLLKVNLDVLFEKKEGEKAKDEVQ